jgi:hypothetical protein
MGWACLGLMKGSLCACGVSASGCAGGGGAEGECGGEVFGFAYVMGGDIAVELEGSVRGCGHGI